MSSNEYYWKNREKCLKYKKEYDDRQYKAFIAETGIKNDHLPLLTATKWGEVYDGYRIHSVTGMVYSFTGSWRTKNQYGWNPMTPCLNSRRYPTVTLQYGKKTLTVTVHSLVMHTINGTPGRLPKIPAKTWKRYSSYAKNFMMQNYWEVNHIDHDTTNFSPSNLEWVSGEENKEKYRAHRAKFGKVA